MVARLLKVGLGALLVVAGIAMLVLPGPGLLTIAVGVALMLSQWPRGRRTLARLRVRSRERYGSHKVRQVERRIPDEICPPSDTRELRELGEVDLAGPPPDPTRSPPDPTDPTDPEGLDTRPV